MATEIKSKELIRPMPIDWWLKNPAYFKYMLRDGASIFIAGYCVFLMVLMSRASGDAASFRAFYEKLASPLSMVLHLIVLAFACYHSITFFNLTPRVIVVFRGDEKVPDHLIAGAHYAAWLLVSLVLIVLVLILV
jgi:fumarate reductase subunit C